MNKLILPFSITTLCLMMSACGGGSNNISEDPIKKPEDTTATGCTLQTSSSCFQFTMEYPIKGIQYTCSSDRVNTFTTQLNGNIVTGGCDKTDTATFFLNATDDFRVELGSVKISNLGRASAAISPVHLTLLDMAEGLTGKPATAMNANDPTVKVAMALVKIFQAVGSQKTSSNVVGDIQLVELTSQALIGLDKITAKVDLAAIQNGSYATILNPWIDVSAISDTQAFKVLKEASNITLGALYLADPPVFLGVTEGLLGYAGTGSTQKTLLGSLFLLSDRQGFTQGYGLQWRGIPASSEGTNVTRALTLLTRTNPIQMTAAAQADWINPINKRLATGERFKFITSQNDTMTINQGRLLDDYMVVGSHQLYKNLTGSSTVVENDLAKWTQNSGSDQFSGGVDLTKAFPISYLDRRVFISAKNVDMGKKYYFPLYATLTFKYNDRTLPDVNLGIVIDENGDILTDVKDWSQTQNLSGQCGTVDSTKAMPVDNFGVQQYRIGTVSAANYQQQQQDLSIAPRMLLSGAHFGVLNGTLLGMNVSLLGNTGSTLAKANGLKLNLFNLINSSGSTLGNINISAYDNTAAQWVNFLNTYKSLYINADKNYSPTEVENDQIKRVVGSLSIQLANCYEVKTKS